MWIKPETYRAIVSGHRNDLTARCARGILALAETPYGWAVSYRNRSYDRGTRPVHRVEVPVVSVGNLTLGGTGKTPFVAWLARWFRQRHVRVSLISRGYGAKTPGGNDELKELAAQLPDVPHLQDPDRVAAARIAIDELDTQLIVLDDGFQHRRLARDLDIVLIDATEPLGYEHLFPRGMLREPIAGLRRADVVALTRCNLVSPHRRSALRSQLRPLAPQAVWVEIAQRPAGLLSSSGRERPLSDRPVGRVLAFCGIGNPSAFQQTFADLAWTLDDFRAFPDHHPYPQTTIADLVDWGAAHPQAGSLICTHKDLVKIASDRLGRLPLFALALQLEITAGRESLEAKLQNLLPLADTP